MPLARLMARWKWLRKTLFISPSLGHIKPYIVEAKKAEALTAHFFSPASFTSEMKIGFSQHSLLYGLGAHKKRKSLFMERMKQPTDNKGFVKVHWNWYGKVAFAVSSNRQLWKGRCGEKLLQLRASASWALTGLLTSQKVITVGRSTRCRAEKVHCNIYRIILWLYGCIAYYAPGIVVLERRTDKPGEYAWRFNRVPRIGVDVRNRREITYTRQQQLMRATIGSTIVFVLFYSDKNRGKSHARTPCHWIKGLLSENLILI